LLGPIDVIDETSNRSPGTRHYALNFVLFAIPADNEGSVTTHDT